MRFTSRGTVVLLIALLPSSLALLYTAIEAVSELPFVHNVCFFLRS